MKNFITNTKAKKIKYQYLFFLLSAFFLSGCSAKPNEPISKSAAYFDTIITVTLYDSSDEQKLDDCMNIAKEYEQLLSATVSDSDIARINSNPGEWVTVDAKTIDVVKKAIYYCNLSNGKFDITIGALTDLWNISQIAGQCNSPDNEMPESVLPDDAKIKELLAHVDYHNIEIDEKASKIKLNDPLAKLDLGGIAKGFIADQMKQYLNENDIKEGIINLGGNLLTLGPKSNGNSYQIGIQYPFDHSGKVIDQIEVKDQSVVTSGVYERYFTVNQKRYHHILSTETGYPADTDLLGVSIISQSSCDGDAISTIVLALGLKDGMAFINSLEDVEAVFITDQYELQYSNANIKK